MKTLKTVNSLLQLSADEYSDPRVLVRLSGEFLLNGYVHLPGFLNRDARDLIIDEVNRLGEIAIPRDFVMPGSETPRRMSTIGGDSIVEASPLIGSLYNHADVIRVVRSLTHQRVYACEHAQEFMVLNILNGRRQTHGWHLDDPPYALIIFAKSPPQEAGGVLEFVPHWRTNSTKIGIPPEKDVLLRVEAARSAGLVQQRSHSAGDAYLLRADEILHRVTEIADERYTRAALNLAYQAARSQKFGNSASLLYAPAHEHRVDDHPKSMVLPS